jgi:hypothetical protein
MKWKAFRYKIYGHTQSSGVSKGFSRSLRCVNPFDTRLGLAVFEGSQAEDRADKVIGHADQVGENA